MEGEAVGVMHPRHLENRHQSQFRQHGAPVAIDPTMNEELPIVELNVLLKFLQILGTIPKYRVGRRNHERGKTCSVANGGGRAAPNNPPGGTVLVDMVRREGG